MDSEMFMPLLLKSRRLLLALFAVISVGSVLVVVKRYTIKINDINIISFEVSLG
jgi:hypothetical protein